ncbi:LysR family transcriptional regulator [Bradyrhizobium sp. Ash2021]|uniref:LysR family transcriptional regulator n=1 Tax=Bradyrhizobium sp. Ash2021 TaxID=2954771 RepID=UPI0028149CAD|nr:LysR family transcriptional regulator [Bradyrhizobium sp. Ash2021]WMT79411.1 LysR family transcriptional regulator [Bradyrhizobium sp. Ash2021]
MDLHGIDLNLLVAFDALMAERSVTRAGLRIGRTQPAMSAALARLRDLLKDDLFVRGQNGLQPTPRAIDLADPLSRALAEIQSALDYTQTFVPETFEGVFTLGLSDHPAFVVLPALLTRIRKSAPGVTLHVRGFTARDSAVRLLDAGEIDAAIGVPAQASGRIMAEALFEEPFVCVVRKNHPVASRKFNLQAYLSLSHLLVSPEGDRFGQVDSKLAEMGLRRNLVVTLPHMYSAPEIIVRSDLVATLMAGVVETSACKRDLAVLAPPLALEPAPFVLTWHRRNDVHPAQRWLRQVISEVSRDYVKQRAKHIGSATRAKTVSKQSALLKIRR